MSYIYIYTGTYIHIHIFTYIRMCVYNTHTHIPSARATRRGCACQLAHSKSIQYQNGAKDTGLYYQSAPKINPQSTGNISQKSAPQ